MIRSFLAQVQIDVNQTGLPQVQASPKSVADLLQIVFGAAGAIAILLVAYGAFRYVISQGDPQSTAKAKDTILYAVIGLILCILSFSIVTFVVKKI